MQRTLFRSLSLVLVLVLLVNMLPMSIFAAELQQSTAELQESTEQVQATEEVSQSMTPSEAYVVQEISEKRTEYSKEFLLSNGLRMAAVYPEAVHYEEGGSWEDIDNTLKAHSDGTYRNTAGVWEVRFPDQLTKDNSVSVTKDGYTLSFAIAGELTGNALSKSTQTLSLGKVTPSSAQVQELSTRKAELTHPETVQDKLHSRLLYSKVYTDTHVQYDLTSNKVKESIIIESYNSSLRGYRYTLDVGEMIPVLEESGQILFYDKEQKNVVMVMPAPYLMDNDHQYSADIQVQLSGKGSTYQLTYLLPQQWLAEEERAWPVILDPVITADMNVNNIRDMTVASGRIYPNNGVLDAGYYNGNDKITQFYLKYDNLPAITSSDVIIHAEIRLRKIENSDNSAPIEVHKVTGTWDSSTITWANKPAHNTTVEDVVTVQNAGHYTWEITDIAQGWYSGANTGMMFKAPDSIENGGVNNFKQFYSSDYTDDDTYQPFLAIVFRNNNGLESYWDYTSSSAGRAGTGYVNNFTGNLTWIREDIGFGGNRMPVSIQHVYNLNDATLVSDNNLSNDTAGNFFGLGNGWRTNYHQRVKYLSSGWYLWEDADSTDHYFFKDTPGLYGTYKDEDGLELTFTNTGSDEETHCITDKDGNKSYFDFYGRLTKLQNNQATKSSITITYTTDTGPYISTITDGTGRVYSFTYYAGTLLTRIIYRGTGTSEISYVNFAYSGANLASITDKDGKVSTYTYSGNLLTAAADPGSYKLSYTYNTPVHSWQPYRVKSIAEADGTTAGGSLSIAYAHNQTTFTDHNNNVEIHQFNDFGNTVCIQDDEGRAQYAQFAFNTDDERSANTDATKRANQLTLSSKLQNTVGNRIKDSSFESDSFWSSNSAALTLTRSTQTAYQGRVSLKMVSTTESTVAAVASKVSVAPGESCTFSAYVKTESAYAIIALQTADYSTYMGEHQGPNRDWSRLQISYTNNTSQTQRLNPILFITRAGTAYMDCVQVESAPSPSRYNLVENGDFTHSNSNSVAYGWSNGGHIESTEVREAISSAAVQLDGWAYRVTGGASRQKHLFQYLPLSGNEGDSYVLSGWGKGNSVPLREYNGEQREFSIVGTFCNTDGTTTVFTVRFNPDVENWQYAAGGMIADKPYSRMIIELKYNFNANTVYFDGIQLFKEEFGSVYDYDADGNVKSVRDIQGQKTQYEYQNNNLTKTILPTGAELTYTYDNYHNVKTATTEEGLVYNFQYDTYGNNTSVSIGSGTNAITATATYSTDGNRLVSTTDAAGNVTNYSYNVDTNVLDWVKYPEDTDATKTTYTYDSMYRMTTAAAGQMSARYTYTDDLLTQLQTPTTAYTFTYGTFDVRTSVKAGDYTLATYTYTDNEDRYLSRLDYGNGDRVQYTYDDKGRVTRQTHEDGAYVSYTYDNSGILTKQYDSATGRTTVYTYDTTGRLMKYTETGTNYSHTVAYGYDASNNLSTLTETTNGVTTTTSYTYDDDNRVTSVTSGGVTKTYTYDALGRVSQQQTKNGNTTILTETISYIAGTSRISSITTSSAGYTQTESYTYDDNGNILTVSDGSNTTSYVYDSANQLIRENNQAGGYTHVWTYDAAGNIKSRTEYAYTTGAVGTATDTANYTYGNGNWGDLLVAYDGGSITYDGVGNPLSDGARTYEWKHGRQLAAVTNSTYSCTYAYNESGQRVQKVINGTAHNFYYTGDKVTREEYGGNVLELYYDAAGRPSGFKFNGTKYYYVTNQQGDVIKILDSSGNVQGSYTYDAWGNTTSMSGDATQYNPLRYRGYFYDSETGLYYVGSRYYNPETGRWINADGQLSTASLTGTNLFTYCLNNPVNMADTTGELPFFLLTAAIGAVAGAIIGGVVAAKSGGNVWAGIGIGAAAGGLAGAGLGAAAGVMLAGSATASTTSVIVGAKAVVSVVGSAGVSAGVKMLADNVSQACSNVSQVFWSGGDLAKNAAKQVASDIGGKTLEMTRVGAYLEQIDAPYSAWQAASSNFANVASNSSSAIYSIQNASGVGVQSIWATIEYQLLQGEEIIYGVVSQSGIIHIMP